MNSGKNNTKPKPFVFILMPFAEEYDDIYSMAIKPACLNAGAYAERVDDQIFHDSILERIYNQISKADIIVADMTDRNANVFYEVGYAHALGKRVILITQNSDDIPFDLKHYPHIVYSGKLKYLLDELQRRVKWSIDNLEKDEDIFELPINAFIDSTIVKDNPTIVCYDTALVIDRLSITFNFNYHVTTFASPLTFKLGFETDKIFSSSSYGGNGKELSVIKGPNGRYLHLYNKQINLYPGAWEQINFNFIKERHSPFKNGEKFDFTLKYFSEIGTVDQPFSYSFERPI